MIKYIIKRILWVIPVMIGVIVIVYTISYNLPGSPMTTRARVGDVGLDAPYIVQLGNYIWRIITRLDLGRSYASGFRVAEELATRLPVTFKLSLLGILLMLSIGLPCGMVSALKQYSALDITLTSISLILAAIPSFVLALLCAILFCVVLRWLPVRGLNEWRAWILPVFCSSVGSLAVYLRMTRTTMLEVIRQDYITTARAKGLKENVVVRKHALKNCLIPLTTIAGLSVANIFAGSIIVETLFSINGMGVYIMSGVLARDYPAINGAVIAMSLLICVVNLVVDVAYAFIDPRIRVQLVSGSKKEKTRKNKAIQF
ncbi:MAG: ABC transporter permease [Clostridiales bacterium]|nr:ABC transporter permease [Clostridiales bacterium]